MVEAPEQAEARGRLRAAGRDRPAPSWPSRSRRLSPALPCTASMCGIVGYVGERPCRDLLIAGLEKLEYRGYDSAGISLLADGEIDTVRAVGNLANLRAAVGLDADTRLDRRRTVRSRSPRRRRRSASAIPAGPPTGGSPRRTRIRTATAPTASTSSSTGSSRTTPSCAASSPTEGHRVQLRDRRRDRRPPDREALRRRPDRRRSATPSPTCAATTPSSPCTPSTRTRWSPRGRSAR